MPQRPVCVHCSRPVNGYSSARGARCRCSGALLEASEAFRGQDSGRGHRHTAGLHLGRAGEPARGRAGLRPVPRHQALQREAQRAAARASARGRPDLWKAPTTRSRPCSGRPTATATASTSACASTPYMSKSTHLSDEPFLLRRKSGPLWGARAGPISLARHHLRKWPAGANPLRIRGNRKPVVPEKTCGETGETG